MGRLERLKSNEFFFPLSLAGMVHFVWHLTHPYEHIDVAQVEADKRRVAFNVEYQPGARRNAILRLKLKEAGVRKAAVNW